MDLTKEVKDVLEAIDDNQDEIRDLIGKSLKIKKFNDFEQKCEELCGVEINPILDYFVQKYKTSRDKFALSFEEFIDITQKWADDSLKQTYHDNTEDEVELDNFDDEREQVQIQSRDNIVLKFDKHAEKLYEIFENYAEPITKIKPKTPKEALVAKSTPQTIDQKSMSTVKPKMTAKAAESKPLTNFETNEEEDRDYPQVKLKKLDRIMDDIAYLTGT